VKLLFDENLSFRLVERLLAEYPGSTHVELIGLRGASDQSVWQYARDNNFILISKDDDFRNLCLVRGAPPKVVWMNLGNAATDQIADLLKRRRADIELFSGSAEESLLILYADA
jgi:predicted nuclease of predicted toxin-antitoxin system